ncbi:MAG: sigma factor-like helix-turn-helix DNA-binding protein [Sphingobium sp.]|uniref:RNA polymerase sigma factor n=1 Tax=Sphingobium sp. TaxID=1912891 RepID=UPI0029B33178|nr:sigma factor-like helix-turn-helix DNA-binding protein [Sphingobium sp.]MDX3908199.1 sigma factor-like helix-turn-helix DNA-binding protein [Sphingobium sp.]
MTHQASASALLQAARDFIAEIPPLALLNAPRRSGRKLVEDIDRLLDTLPWKAALPDILEETRERWQDEHRVRIDNDATMRSDAKGLWISAWVLAGPPVQSLDPQQFRKALDTLPVMQREVYVLHRIEGQPLSKIADRLGLTVGQSTALFVAALRSLHGAIHGRQD